MKEKQKLQVQYVPINILKGAEYNPRKWDKTAESQLKESILRFGLVDPIVCNNAPGRENVIIGGHFRLEMAKELKYETVPVVYLNIPDIEKEKELNLRLNRNTGEFDWSLLANFAEDFLSDAGFSSEEIDDVFPADENPEIFDLEKELKKLDIQKIELSKGDMLDLDGSRLMVGDSTVEQDILKLTSGDRIDATITDPPYRLMYLGGGKRKEGPTTGFGLKKNRRYLETDELPPDFTQKWMDNVAKVSAQDSSIIVYENWKNIREIWGEMEKHWKVRNMLVWHLPNRNQGYAGRNKFFSKHDIAMLGTSQEYSGLNLRSEGELFDNEYESAFFGIRGKGAHWESYKKGRKYCPTDFIEFNAADQKSSGQSIVFGVKPLPILLPYVKVLTRRNQIILEPFGGSGSTLIASIKLGRRCYLMEKSPVYAQVILKRWERLTNLKPKKI